MTVFLDYETSGLNYWEPGFEVRSMAVSYVDPEVGYANIGGELHPSIVSAFFQGRDDISRYLKTLADAKVPVWAYNVSFEIGVTLCNFPGIDINWVGDVQRLVQIYDNGDDSFVDFLKAAGEWTDEEEDVVDTMVKRKSLSGFGLKVAGPRILGKGYKPVEQRAYQVLRDMGIRKGDERKHLGDLPENELRDYNVGDTENTLKLGHKILTYFKSINYDWTIDHKLYMSTCMLVTKAKIRGVRVDRERLETYAASIEAELADIEHKFRSMFAVPIGELECDAWELAKSARKTQRGKDAVPKPTFNIGSNQQLARLFVGKLGMRARFKSDKGQPSFRKSHLPSWGTGGEILAKRRQRMLVRNQCLALLNLSIDDGRWHLSLKPVGTSTGRLAGGN